MTKYVVKRVLLAILTVFIVCAITFFAMNAIPGGPFDGEKAISDEVRRVLEQRFNLDKPVWEQFFLYLNNLLHGDFGVSAKTGREIKTTIFSSFSVSAKLGGMAVLVALISGVVMGSIAALTRNKLPDRLIIFFSTLFTSLPSFVLGTLLLLVFCIKLKWVPQSGYYLDLLVLPSTFLFHRYEVCKPNIFFLCNFSYGKSSAFTAFDFLGQYITAAFIPLIFTPKTY